MSLSVLFTKATDPQAQGKMGVNARISLPPVVAPPSFDGARCEFNLERSSAEHERQHDPLPGPQNASRRQRRDDGRTALDI